MNQQGAPSFVYNIPSIHQKRPTIPAALGTLDLNRQVVAGDPLDYQRVVHAKSVAAVLRGLRDAGDPQISQEMVTVSASRAVAVESAFAASEFCPQDIGQVLQQINHHLGNVDNQLGVMNNRLDGLDNRFGNVDNRFDNIDNRLRNIDDSLRGLTNDVQAIRAHTFNMKIITRNKLNSPADLEPLQKTVAGNGRNLALPLIAVMEPAGRQNFHQACPLGANAPLIGSTPPNFDGRVDTYTHLDICKLVVFYNETFGITPQDRFTTRAQKFCRYLSHY